MISLESLNSTDELSNFRSMFYINLLSQPPQELPRDKLIYCLVKDKQRRYLSRSQSSVTYILNSYRVLRGISVHSSIDAIKESFETEKSLLARVPSVRLSDILTCKNNSTV